MYEIITESGDLEWVDIDFPGVSIKTLHRVEGSGALTVMTRMEPVARSATTMSFRGTDPIGDPVRMFRGVS